MKGVCVIRLWWVEYVEKMERWNGYGIEKREDERLGVENRIEKKWIVNSCLGINEMLDGIVGSQKGLYVVVIGV